MMDLQKYCDLRPSRLQAMSPARPAARYSPAGKESVRPPPRLAVPAADKRVWRRRLLTALAGADLLRYAHALLAKAAS